jgi:DNA invertase Pin-like site-specific DNA recombinase
MSVLVMNIGYVRISTRDQSTQLQDAAMTAAGITKVFADIGVSGSLASRPEFDKALAHLREGDTLVVWKLDRMGRNTRNVLEVIEGLTDRGVGFRSLTEGLDTTGPWARRCCRSWQPSVNWSVPRCWSEPMQA